MKKETRAVWFPYLEFQDILTGKSREAFRDQIKERFDVAAEWGIDRLFVHVRPFGDALYPSRLFPTSHLITGTEGDPAPFDPLAIMVEEAHGRGLALEAWVNPFRVRAPGMAAVSAGLCRENPALEWRETGDVIEYRGGLTYDPGSQRAQERIVAGLREICENYPVDGIHFDDYFYPTADPNFDMDGFCRYKLAGGGLSQRAWRLQNVRLFLRACHAAVHASGCGRFGVSPKGFMECNLEEEFLDVPGILAKEGYVDYICPQAYFAMTDEVCPFSAVMEEYDRLIGDRNIDLLAGLAVYKLGRRDIHAGPGDEEWLRGEGTLVKMVECARKAEHYAGYSLYNYQASFLPEAHVARRVEEELDRLMALG